MAGSIYEIDEALKRVGLDDTSKPHKELGKVDVEMLKAAISAGDKKFADKGGEFFHIKGDAFETANHFVDTHIKAHRGQDNIRPSLTALAIHHVGDIKDKENNQKYYDALILSTLLAEGNLGVGEQAYHNRNHFVDVTAVTANLAAKNNEMAARPDNKTAAVTLSEKDQLLLMIAASVHDLGHGGKGNSKEEGADQFANERASFDKAQPLLLKCGLSEEDQLKVKTIILATTPDAPGDVFRKIARAHLKDPARDWSKVDAAKEFPEVEKYPELNSFVKDRKLTQMASMVITADLYASSGAGLVSSKEMSKVLSEECGNKIDFTTDKSRMWFFTNIVGGREGYPSAAGVESFNDSYRELRRETRRNIWDEKIQNHRNQNRSM